MGQEASQITSLIFWWIPSLPKPVPSGSSPSVITGAEKAIGWAEGSWWFQASSAPQGVPAAAAAPPQSSWIFTPSQSRGVDLEDDGGLGEKHENCCSHYTLGFHAHKCLIFSLDYCSKCSSFVSKTKTTFLLLLIFGKWCIMGFWSEGLIKSTDISFLSSSSGPFLFALYGKGLERFLLFPSPPLFLVQSWGFFLNIQTFYRLTSFKTLRGFFSLFFHHTKEYF